MAASALSGIRVLEYGQLLAAPYCGKLLADLGAEVVKIEPPLVGDQARHRGPFLHDVPHPETSALFLYLNANKRSVTLNPALASGQELFRKLAVDVHILVEDTRPGTLDAWGLGYARLREVNPGLVMTSITPFGQRGPYSQYKAYPLNIAHATGEASLMPAGQPFDGSRPPVRVGQWVASLDGGTGAAIATLAALYARLLTGRGAHIDISVQEQGMSLIRRELTSHFWEGWNESRKERGPRPGSLIRCKDGHVMLFLLHQHHYRHMTELMGKPDWASDERFSTPASRVKHAEALNELVSAWAQHYPRREVYERAQKAGVPAGIVRDVRDLLEWPQYAARGSFQDLEHPVAGRVRQLLPPYRHSATPAALQRAAPLLGQDNEEVYVRRLGVARSDLARLHAGGVI